ncbi:hypothetical protein H6F32_09245 [Anabaena sp. FACHB-1237]|nr:hypothetical protein [Anabaena sp. FACHB-1237]
MMLSPSGTENPKIEPGIESSLQPMGDLSTIVGYAGNMNILSSEIKSNNSDSNKPDRNKLLKLATKILDNPQMQILLGNRVYELMQEDLYYQEQRNLT